MGAGEAHLARPVLQAWLPACRWGRPAPPNVPEPSTGPGLRAPEVRGRWVQAEQLELSPVDRYFKIKVMAGARGAASCWDKR